MKTFRHMHPTSILTYSYIIVGDHPPLPPDAEFPWDYPYLPHRFDAPAVVYSVFDPDWYIMGNLVHRVEYPKWCKEMGIDLNNLSENDISLILMKWGDE